MEFPGDATGPFRPNQGERAFGPDRLVSLSDVRGAHQCEASRTISIHRRPKGTAWMDVREVLRVAGRGAEAEDAARCSWPLRSQRQPGHGGPSPSRPGGTVLPGPPPRSLSRSCAAGQATFATKIPVRETAQRSVGRPWPPGGSRTTALARFLPRHLNQKFKGTPWACGLCGRPARALGARTESTRARRLALPLGPGYYCQR